MLCSLTFTGHGKWWVSVLLTILQRLWAPHWSSESLNALRALGFIVVKLAWLTCFVFVSSSLWMAVGTWGTFKDRPQVLVLASLGTTTPPVRGVRCEGDWCGGCCSTVWHQCWMQACRQTACDVIKWSTGEIDELVCLPKTVLTPTGGGFSVVILSEPSFFKHWSVNTYTDVKGLPAIRQGIRFSSIECLLSFRGDLIHPHWVKVFFVEYHHVVEVVCKHHAQLGRGMVVACCRWFNYLILFSNSVFKYPVFPTHITNQPTFLM